MAGKGCRSCKFVKYEVQSKGIVEHVYCNNEISEHYGITIEGYGGCRQYERARQQRIEERKTNLQQVKEDIKNANSAAEMAGILDGINAAAVVYCMQHCKEEIYRTKGGIKTTICGMIEFLDAQQEKIALDNTPDLTP